MRVTAVPPLTPQVSLPLQPDRLTLLPGLDHHLGSQRLVLKSASSVNNYRSSRQPTFAASVDVGVGDLAEANIAAYVSVPRTEVAADVAVVAVGCVRDSRRRPE